MEEDRKISLDRRSPRGLAGFSYRRPLRHEVPNAYIRGGAGLRPVQRLCILECLAWPLSSQVSAESHDERRVRYVQLPPEKLRVCRMFWRPGAEEALEMLWMLGRRWATLPAVRGYPRADWDGV